MKRFYKNAAVVEQDTEFTVELDGRKIKTPEKSLCLMPTKEMAEKVAEEWNDQGDEIDTFSMPITKLMNTAIDRVGKRRTDLIDELVKYAGSDQLCYRADHPQELITRQNNIWNPLLKYMKNKYEIDLNVSTGIMFIDQNESALNKVRTLLEEIESFKLTSFYGMTTVTGSVTIAFNLFEGNIDVDEAWNAGHLDENFQVEEWGSDEEAEERRKALREELDNAVLFQSLCP